MGGRFFELKPVCRYPSGCLPQKPLWMGDSSVRVPDTVICCHVLLEIPVVNGITSERPEDPTQRSRIGQPGVEGSKELQPMPVRQHSLMEHSYDANPSLCPP